MLNKYAYEHTHLLNQKSSINMPDPVLQARKVLLKHIKDQNFVVNFILQLLIILYLQQKHYFKTIKHSELQKLLEHLKNERPELVLFDKFEKVPRQVFRKVMHYLRKIKITPFAVGNAYEKLISKTERKEKGVFFTPQLITTYICENTIIPYLLDKINEKYGTCFKTIDDLINSNNEDIIVELFKELLDIKILDPACGSGHFLETAMDTLLSIYEKIRKKARELNIRQGLEIKLADDNGKVKNVNIFEMQNLNDFRLFVKRLITRNLYGVDINQDAIKIAKARLILAIIKHLNIVRTLRFNIWFNLRVGNSLIGFVSLDEICAFSEKQT